MVRAVTADDTGLRVLHKPAKLASAEQAQIIDIVAIHGIGSHPDDTWSKDISTDPKTPQYVNWLSDKNMLPSVTSNIRVLRYGYESEWFGNNAIRQKVSTVADRFLLALKREREKFPSHPIILIAHCFGGLVVLKALLEAQHNRDEWPGIFDSITGLIFLGTPFRGAEGMKPSEMFEAARREYEEEHLQTEVLRILEPGNEFLQDLVDQFGKIRKRAHKAQVACFYELKPSNVGHIVGRQDRMRFIVNESSGCLDLSESIEKYSLSRTHFNMNKFAEPTEEDFEIVSNVIEKMVKSAPVIVAARSQLDGKYKILNGSNDDSRMKNACLTSLAYKEMRSRKLGIFSADPKTCQWLLGHKNFNDWINSNEGLLWIKGKPGAGKSVLMLFIHEKAQLYTKYVSHVKLNFFFHGRGSELEKSPLGMFRSLLFQLYDQEVAARKQIQEAFDKNSDAGEVGIKWDWTDTELKNLFFDLIVQISQSKRITIFVDALDESGESVANQIAAYLNDLNEKVMEVKGMTRICFSSRHHPIVSAKVAKNCIIKVEDSNAEGIRLYVRKELQGLDTNGTIKEEDAIDKLEEALVAKSSGVFQWVRLVLSMFSKADRNRESLDYILRLIEQLPFELNKVYQHIFENTIEVEHRVKTLALFQWVCLSARPLSLHEVRHAMAIDDKPSSALTHDHSGLGGLVEVRDQEFGSTIVQVTHQTVRDFLFSKELKASEKDKTWLRLEDFVGVGHDNLTKSCINYLRTEEVQEALDISRMQAHSDQSKLKVEIENNLPLLRYTTTACFWHASKAEINGCFQHDLPRQLGFNFTRRALWQSVRVANGQVFDVWRTAAALYGPRDFFGAVPSDGSTLLHIASMANLDKVVRDLLNNWAVKIDEKDKHGRQAIHYAARGGAKEVLQTLIHRPSIIRKYPIGKSLINSEDNSFVTPLQLAARYGHAEIIRVLLQEKAKVKLHTTQKPELLKDIKVGEIEKVTKLLLEDAAEFNVQSLQTAASRGNLDTVTLFLAEGADVNAQGKYGTALASAAQHGQKAVVEMLLKEGADVNAQGKNGIALISAAQNGHEAIVEMLLKEGADVNAQGQIGTALISAAQNGHEAIVEMLLKEGANVDIGGGKYGNALAGAAQKNHTTIVEVLLNAKANINCFLKTMPLAIRNSAKSILPLLGIVLHTAAKLGRLDVVDEVVAFNIGDDGALHSNSILNQVSKSLNTLVNQHASTICVSASWNSRQALQAAAGSGHLEVVNKLISLGADVDSAPADWNGRTALQAAAEGGHLEVANRLISVGADVNAAPAENNGLTALQAAARSGHLEVVNKLISVGVGVNAAPAKFGGRTALQAATGSGHLEVIDLLQQELA